MRKPSPLHDQYVAPTPDLEGYRIRLREAFGNTMSDEFVEVMLGKVVEALKPSPFDKLEEPTFNAALAIIDSAQCRSELEAFIAVQIVATGFSGLRFLRQSHKHMTEEYISVYGNYANKLLRLELDLMQALDRHRRGHKQTVEVRHVHMHREPKGWLASLTHPENLKWRAKIDERPHASGRHCASAGKYGQGAPLRRQDSGRPTLPASGRNRPSPLSDARRRERLGRPIGCSERQFQARPLDPRGQA